MHSVHSIPLTMVLAIIIGLLFVKPYLGTVVFSILIAFVFNPIYQWLMRHTKRHGLAIIATLCAAILSVLIPVFVISVITVSQANAFMSQLKAQDQTTGTSAIDDAIATGTERINTAVAALPGSQPPAIDREQIGQWVKDAAAAVASGLVSIVKQTGGALASLTTSSILAFFIITALLRYQSGLLNYIRTISPYPGAITNDYLRRAGLMTKAMIKGQFIIATVQGFASALSLWFIGFDYFWFFFVILGFLSFIPLGAGILTMPLGIVIMISGHPWQGLFLIGWHLIVVTNIDNLLRPYLVPKDARLNPALLLLAVFSGMAVFGAIGVIYGPVIMTLLVTTFELYARYSRQISPDAPPPNALPNATTGS